MLSLKQLFTLLPSKRTIDLLLKITAIVIVSIFLTSLYKDIKFNTRINDYLLQKKKAIATPNINTLIKTISTPSTGRQSIAGIKLGEMGEKGLPALPTLLKIFDNAVKISDRNTEDAAVNALSMIGAYNIESIIEYANKNDPIKFGGHEPILAF
jgi:hypothetical protein